MGIVLRSQSSELLTFHSTHCNRRQSHPGVLLGRPTQVHGANTAPNIATKPLTVDEALVAGGKADARQGFDLISALYSSKNNQICYTYFAEGIGPEYELARLEDHSWAYWHSNGLKEFSSGRLSSCEADEEPCHMYKRIWRNTYKAPAKGPDDDAGIPRLAWTRLTACQEGQPSRWPQSEKAIKPASNGNVREICSPKGEGQSDEAFHRSSKDATVRRATTLGKSATNHLSRWTISYLTAA